jgi:hypothetical protein
MRRTLKVLIGLYIGAACLTLIFQTYVRSSQCAGVSNCGFSLARGAAWSVIWPGFWAEYDARAACSVIWQAFWARYDAAPADVTVDAEWYLSQYPDVRAAIQDGHVKSALDHYRTYGYFEKRLPSKPMINEAWYLRRYPDVAQAIREGRETTAYNHFIKYGYLEGRIPRPGSIKRQAPPNQPVSLK